MRSRVLGSVGVCAAVVLGAGGVSPAAVAAPVGGSAGAADFNGDGYPDLAVGAHTATLDGVKRAGAVTIAYGSASGLRYETASVVGQGTPGVPGDPVEDGKWREVSGFGDLDGDGNDDLVVRWVEKNVVLWGSEDGITGAGTALPPGSYRPESPKLLGGGFGVGDVNGDGVDDYVSRAADGSSYGVTALLGPLDRVTGASAGVWYRDTAKEDKFLLSTAYVGDVTGDGVDDIVAGGGVVLGNGKAGGAVFTGSRGGLVKGAPFKGPYRHDSHYPSAFGDLNGDGYQDLVTGYPSLDQVYVTYGGPDGASSTLASRAYTQASAGVPGVQEDGDRFGSSVAVGDTDQDGFADVVIGASYETGSDVTATAGSGAVTVLRGSASGITTEGAKVFTQNSAGVPSTSEENDHFGAAAVVSDTDRDGRPEVYVGGNGEDGFKGRVFRLATGAGGVTGAGATSFHLGTLGGPAGGGNFGYRMAG
ncbi:integrin alpha pat-2 [Streptomyces sp. ODS05-4]|uniref:integrin alpha pat-2 n=1 Tax=Streptomyces sp. ODS05-4 TaxID=2944939 RepID=UPI0021098C89|nr:integrin alpha pat-2 [Streptomyces sp. ODS05-4]